MTGIQVMIALPPAGSDAESKPHDWDSAYRAFGAARVKAAIDAAVAWDEMPYESQEAREREIERLAQFKGIDFEREKKKAAKRLGIEARALPKIVKEHRDANEIEGQGARLLAPVEPWSDAVNGAELLHDLSDSVRRYVVLSEYAAEAVALWCVFSHCHDAASHSPILAIESPAPRCGKTTLMKVVGSMVPKPLAAANVRPAAVFRTIDTYRPTLLLDEADTFIRHNEELRGILNSGHERQLAYVIRTVGDNHEPKQFPTWCAKAVALIGFLPTTLQDRAIAIRLRRKATTEKVERLPRNAHDRFADLRSMCARWAKDNIAHLARAEPVMPPGLNDRAADNWRTLLAIADQVGGDWPEIARAAAQSLSGPDGSEDTASLEVRLLGDVRRVMYENRWEWIGATPLVLKLIDLDDAPWGELNNGRPMTARGMAMMLRPFGIKPRHTRNGSQYDATMFTEAWLRYLPMPVPPEGGAPD